MNVTLPHRFAENGARIRKARKGCGMSQERFAEAIGTTRRHMIRLENGEHLPQSSLRDRMVTVAGADVDAIEASDDDEEAESMPLTGSEFALLGDLMARLGTSLARSQA